MDVLGKKVQTQVQFWALLGPFFVLLSIAVLLFKVSPHWHFPVSALLGIPLCVKWKMKGMAISLGCLFLFGAISYPDLELDDRYWHVGLSLTMAFSFIVLTLSLEEAQTLIGKLQLESQSRLDNFLLIDEKWKTAEQDWILEREQTKTEVENLTQQLTKIQEDKQTFYKLAQLAKDELVQIRGQHNQLFQDILYKKQQIAQLHERLEETELTIQEFINSDPEKNTQTLKERLACVEREKETLQAKFLLIQEEKQVCQSEKEHLLVELRSCREEHKKTNLALQQNLNNQQSNLRSLENKYAIIEKDKHALVESHNSLRDQYNQTCQLKDQCQQVLQQAQYKIEGLEAKLSELEKTKRNGLSAYERIRRTSL